MPQRRIEGLHNTDLSCSLTGRQRRGVADLLKRQQEEYGGYPIEKIGRGITPAYLHRLEAAHQAAFNAITTAKDDRPNWSAMCVAVIAAFSVLLLLKFKFG